MMPHPSNSMTVWSLDRLLFEALGMDGAPAVPVDGIAMDSRRLMRGGLFLACAGLRQHGMEHVADAVAAGAVAILAEPAGEWSLERLSAVADTLSVPLLPVVDLAAKAGELASCYFGDPSSEMRVVGVTGTNGKTSVTQYLAQALAEDWYCGLVGTLGYGFAGRLQDTGHTTPDAVSVQRALSELEREGAQAVAMEVSSHALHQSRVDAVSFHTAVFTNLSRDHLDYHGDMLAYAEAKARLFRRAGISLAVLNIDDSTGRELADELRGRVSTVVCSTNGERPDGFELFVRAGSVRREGHGLRILFDSSWGKGELHCPLLGHFNVENTLLVMGVLLAWGVPLRTVLQRIEALQAVPGRMELFGSDDQPAVVVDFAHTPDALEKVLDSLRPHATGKLCVVFGCGGDRDRGKRPQMGAIAERLADRVVLTDDNPRTEDGAAIIAEIQSGMSRPGSAAVIRNRAEAIREAIAQAGAGDLVLVAGKGHEDYQLIGDLKQPFSDSEQVRRALREWRS